MQRGQLLVGLLHGGTQHGFLGEWRSAWLWWVITITLRCSTVLQALCTVQCHIPAHAVDMRQARLAQQLLWASIALATGQTHFQRRMMRVKGMRMYQA